MTKYTSTNYCGSFTDDDSGIGADLNSSSETLAESLFLPTMTIAKTEKRASVVPLIKFRTDGVVERVRPATMKNSENGDYILCRTARGAYVAYRTPIVPQWVTQLVQEIEFRQQ